MEAPRVNHSRTLRQKDKKAIKKKKMAKMDSSIKTLVRLLLPLHMCSSEPRLIHDIVILAGRIAQLRVECMRSHDQGGTSARVETHNLYLTYSDTHVASFWLYSCKVVLTLYSPRRRLATY